MIVVSNTSPITNLAAIGYLDLLQQLYSRIIIPQAVYNEMAGLEYNVPGTVEVQTLSWIQAQQVADLVRVAELQTEIDPGESEAIALAIELNADRLLLDDYQGRVVASSLDINVIGLLGVLLLAKQRGLIETVKPLVDDLIAQAGFRVSDSLYAQILRTAEEQ